MSVDMSQLTDTFTSMADAIREKTGSTSAFTPAQMITEIGNIHTGIATYILPNTYASSIITSYTGNENLILDYAFMRCNSLTTVSFPQCTYIGNSVFYSCSRLSTISFPKCSYIEGNVFYSCISLTSAIFPECTYIGNRAFYYCNRLTTVSFPNCSYIESSAFWGCNNLTNISFPNVSYIGSSAFGACRALTNISFPKCSYIGNSAFAECTRLSSLYLLSTSIVSLYDANAFNSTPLSRDGTGNIYVPSSLVARYKITSKWSNISNRITSYNG